MTRAPASSSTGVLSSGFWSRLRSLTRKEVRQLMRDRSNIAFGLLLPITLILVFGYGISLDVRDARVAVVQDAPTPQSRDVLSGLALSPWLAPMPVASMSEAARLLGEERVDAIVHVPSDFARALAAGDARVQLVVQGGDAATARVMEGYVTAALGQWTRERSGSSAQSASPDPGSTSGPGAPGVVVVEPRLWFNAANTSTWYLVPGLVVLIMTLVGAFLTSLLVAREWERGTMEALLVTPVRPAEILLSKMLPYFAVGAIGCALCLAAARWLFGVPFEGSLALIVLACALYLLVALGLGLFISSATKNQFLASQVALLASFMPAMMLSGFLFDLRNVPAVVRAVGSVLPATHFMQLLKTLLLVGDVPAVVVPDLLLLTGYAAGFVAAARVVTRKRLP
jgi:ABC-2 type transport system permease protein